MIRKLLQAVLTAVLMAIIVWAFINPEVGVLIIGLSMLAGATVTVWYMVGSVMGGKW